MLSGKSDPFQSLAMPDPILMAVLLVILVLVVLLKPWEF